MPVESLPRPRPRPGRGLTVLVVVGHRLIAESVARVLPQVSSCVAVATPVTTLSAAADVARRRSVDVVLLDALLVDGDVERGGSLRSLGAETGRLAPGPAVLLFSPTAGPLRAATALRNGAAGWVPHDSSPHDLAEALEVVRAGGRWVPPQLRAGVIDALLDIGPSRSAGSVLDGLSSRQRDVLRCLLAGMSHGEAADRLHLSLSTVRTHVQHMCRLTGVHSTPALVAQARAWGVARPAEA